MHEASPLEYLKLAIFYAGWLYVPAAAFLVWATLMRSARSRLLAAGLLLPLTALAYARFVEPRILLTVEHDIALKRCFPESGAFRLAVFSDMHIGIFGNAMPIARIAAAVEAAKPNAALIAGDFTYHLAPERFDAAFAALGAIGAPVYAVLGNHDVGLPGRDVSSELKASNARLGLIDIENRLTVQSIRGAVEFAGLSDSWQGRQDMSVVAGPAPVPRIVLTHNPKTLLALPPDAAVDLLVAGHTHGGQIYLPFITCAVAEIACNPIRYGFKQFDRGGLFVTSGTGMIGLPMRFLVPPRVDALNVSYMACKPN